MEPARTINPPINVFGSAGSLRTTIPNSMVNVTLSLSLGTTLEAVVL